MGMFPQLGDPITLLTLFLICTFFSHSSSIHYIVGDSLWNIPPYPQYFSEWSSSHFFTVGDYLDFDFETNLYNLIEVIENDYEDCTSYNPIKVFQSGPVNVSLTEEGIIYFICNISNYCSLGLKMAVMVHQFHPPENSPSPLPLPSPTTSSPNPSSWSSQPPGSASPSGSAGGESCNTPVPSSVNYSPSPFSNDVYPPGQTVPLDRSWATALMRKRNSSSNHVVKISYQLVLEIGLFLPLAFLVKLIM